jgi:hypothetical protein
MDTAPHLGVGTDIDERPLILHRIKVFKSYQQFKVAIDISDFFPFSALRGADQLFPKLGLVIKRQFGYLGYEWGYGELQEVREGETAPVPTAPVSLTIYFPQEVTEAFLLDNVPKFEKILRYLVHEWNVFKGTIEEDW